MVINDICVFMLCALIKKIPLNAYLLTEYLQLTWNNGYVCHAPGGVILSCSYHVINKNNDNTITSILMYNCKVLIIKLLHFKLLVVLVLVLATIRQ